MYQNLKKIFYFSFRWFQCNFFDKNGKKEKKLWQKMKKWWLMKTCENFLQSQYWNKNWFSDNKTEIFKFLMPTIMSRELKKYLIFMKEIRLWTSMFKAQYWKVYSCKCMRYYATAIYVIIHKPLTIMLKRAFIIGRLTNVTVISDYSNINELSSALKDNRRIVV